MEIQLHEKQSLIFQDDTRFKVVAAGRRFGKSYLAAVILYTEGAKTEHPISGKTFMLSKVYYVAPTFKQGMENLWDLLIQMGEDFGIIHNINKNIGEITLTNRRVIAIKGADDPKSLRGVGLSYCVLDEYAFMKEEVWEAIIRPMFLTTGGGAMFIGTPDGKNHFYRLHQMASDPEVTNWRSWTFGSTENPHIDESELDDIIGDMSDEIRKQELEASFAASAGKVFTAKMFPIVDESPAWGEKVIAIDLAGFSKTGVRVGHIEILDDHALAVATVHDGGWHIDEVQYGKWDVRETALRIIRLWENHRPVRLGIEKGMAFNAVMPYMMELQAKYGLYFDVEPLTHGNNRKEDRIKWALQGRAEEGKITLQKGEWNEKFITQALDFPSRLAHDDLIDAVSYVDQLQDGVGGSIGSWDDGGRHTWAPIDTIAGY